MPIYLWRRWPSLDFLWGVRMPQAEFGGDPLKSYFTSCVFFCYVDLWCTLYMIGTVRVAVKSWDVNAKCRLKSWTPGPQPISVMVPFPPSSPPQLRMQRWVTYSRDSNYAPFRGDLPSLWQDFISSPSQGRSDGGIYRYIYPQNQSTLQIFMWLLVVFFSLWPRTNSICGTLTCFDFDIEMTIVKIYTLQMNILATPLLPLYKIWQLYIALPVQRYEWSLKKFLMGYVT